MMSKYIFETKMEVRDYECDIEGIVNNANYLHYIGAYPPSLPEGMRPQLCRNAQQGCGCCGGENEPAVQGSAAMR